MLIFGIDPGSTVTGYGVVRSHRGRIHYVDSGIIRTKSSEEMGVRLKRIYDGLCDAMDGHALDGVAIEAIFRHKSSESALRLGQARGVALLAAAKAGFDAVPYNPMTVKRTVGAHGRADKQALGRMVCMLLGITIDGPADRTDALAIAITHLHHVRNAGLGAR